MKPTAAELIHAQRNELRRETNAMFAAVRMPPKGATVASEAARLRRIAAAACRGSRNQGPSDQVPLCVAERAEGTP
jgi:hypothetical protein